MTTVSKLLKVYLLKDGQEVEYKSASANNTDVILKGLNLKFKLNEIEKSVLRIEFNKSDERIGMMIADGKTDEEIDLYIKESNDKILRLLEERLSLLLNYAVVLFGKKFSVDELSSCYGVDENEYTLMEFLDICVLYGSEGKSVQDIRDDVKRSKKIQSLVQEKQLREYYGLEESEDTEVVKYNKVMRNLDEEGK